MEEILSSIKRIIAEDSEAALSVPRARRSVASDPADVPEPILELTDPVAADEPEPVAAHPLEEEPVAVIKAAKPEPVKPEPVKTEPVKTEPVKTEDVPVMSSKPHAVEAPSSPTLVSSSTVEASRSSLAALSALVVKPEITGSDTLEGLVREMIRPMIAEWLDSRLPEIVDRMVQQEISRITRS